MQMTTYVLIIQFTILTFETIIECIAQLVLIAYGRTLESGFSCGTEGTGKF